jgi:ElaB/YqjD/DUF883 family membrane-anchored ribosome-binding protein
MLRNTEYRQSKLIVDQLMSKMEELLNKISILVKGSDDAARQRIMESLHKLAYSTERPEDTRDRFSLLVRVSAP